MDSVDKAPSKHIETVKTEGKAIGPYSAGKVVSANAKMIYLSGQLGINREVYN
jgi:enamine deaminase RidA (YjgF/YER057c/UK114 family)